MEKFIDRTMNVVMNRRLILPTPWRFSVEESPPKMSDNVYFLKEKIGQTTPGPKKRKIILNERSYALKELFMTPDATH